MKKIIMIAMVAVFALTLIGVAAHADSAFDFAKKQYQATGDTAWITYAKGAATDAIAQATLQAGGKALDEVAKANDALAKGNAVAATKGVEAIDQYKVAYDHAQKAIEIVGGSLTGNLVVDGTLNVVGLSSLHNNLDMMNSKIVNANIYANGLWTNSGTQLFDNLGNWKGPSIGLVGPAGPTGEVGPTGPQGLKGDTGDMGPVGAIGPTGEVGPIGPQGLKGDKGDQGDTGLTGATGLQGLKGDKGDQGDTGLTGATGLQGLKGDKGDQGDTGLTGATGLQGLKGDKGDTGAIGATGLQGLKGDKGDQGDTGLTGATGLQGLKGDKGDQGIQGLKGDKGDQGIQGIQGLTGNIGLQGLKGDKGDQGIQGIQGIQGDTGATGADSTIPGPAGATGPKGDTGPQGPEGPAGAFTASGTNVTYTAGNVGIGTATPTATFQVVGSAIFDGTMKVTGPISGGSPVDIVGGLTVMEGDCGIGTANPEAKLDVAGNIKIADGTEGANKVLTSDDNGVASWQTPAAPQGNSPGDMQYWNGTAWVMVPVGSPGQYLQLSASNVPSWGGTVPTGESELPATLTTTSISAITQTTATSGGNITNDGGAAVTARGICWNTSGSPTISDSKTTDGSGIGSFTSDMSSLTAGNTYYVRAYATNSVGTSYGNQLSFTTAAAATLATLTTTAPTAITQTTATSGGNITNDGGALITERGICYSTSPNPTTLDNKLTSGSGTGSFTSNITGLSTVITTYYVRAYAINSVGTSYGNEVSFTTVAATLATLTTRPITAITPTTATSGGNITNDGGSPVYERGICYSASPNPTTANYVVISGSGTGSFTADMSNLQTGNTYYVRAYAINSVGTAYGDELSFTTTVALSLPTVTTAAISNISVTTASSGGNVVSDGGAAVTARGVCWNTGGSPIVSGNKTTDGTGILSFTSSITGLTVGTTYYVRAYATNSVGTSYGDQVSFNTVGVGSAYQGGKVFYIDAGNKVGYIGALSDTSQGIMWGPGTYIGPVGTLGTAIGAGESNTNKLVAIFGAGSYAAKLCADLIVTAEGVTYDDWFLPSEQELWALKLQQNVFGNFTWTKHWTSNESADSPVWARALHFDPQYDYFFNNGKNNAFWVRAIRHFHWL